MRNTHEGRIKALEEQLEVALSRGGAANARADLGKLETRVTQSFGPTAITGAFPVDHPDAVNEVLVTVGQIACATGESVAVDVQKNGVSILAAPVVVDHSIPAGTQIAAQLAAGPASAPIGAQFTSTGNYTPGNTPAFPNIAITLK